MKTTDQIIKNQLEQLKAKCIVVWGKYQTDTRYYKEKTDRVKSIKYPEDAYILINMFDWENQKELWGLLTREEQEIYKDLFSKYVLMELGEIQEKADY